MLKPFAIGLLLVGFAAPALAPAKAQQANWSYSGANGPSAWHTLSNGYAQCSTGKFQSPINIEGTEPAVMHRLRSNYLVAPVNMVNTRLGIAADYPAGSELKVGPKTFALNGFMFKSPAEHTVAGEAFPLSLQFIHRAQDGSRAIVVSLVKEGRENLAMSELTPHLPLEPDQRNRRPEVLFNARDLMPNDSGYYRYSGSLTMPPCSEGISWYVLKDPIEMSKEQINLIKGVIGGTNARPLQNRGNRIIMDARGQ